MGSPVPDRTAGAATSAARQRRTNYLIGVVVAFVIGAIALAFSGNGDHSGVSQAQVPTIEGGARFWSDSPVAHSSAVPSRLALHVPAPAPTAQHGVGGVSTAHAGSPGPVWFLGPTKTANAGLPASGATTPPGRSAPPRSASGSTGARHPADPDHPSYPGRPAAPPAHRPHPPVSTAPVGAPTTAPSAPGRPSGPTRPKPPGKPAPAPPRPTQVHPVGPGGPPTPPVRRPPAPPAPSKAQRSVAIAQGSEVPHTDCGSSGRHHHRHHERRCRFVSIALSNFGPGAHTFSCADSADGTFATFTGSDAVESSGCWVPRAFVWVWVTVDGVRSNVLGWF